MTPLPKKFILPDDYPASAVFSIPDHELDGTEDVWAKEPAKPLIHPCHCDIVTIMQSGCTCGGE